MQLHIDCTDYRFFFLYQWMMTLAAAQLLFSFVWWNFSQCCRKDLDKTKKYSGLMGLGLSNERCFSINTNSFTFSYFVWWLESIALIGCAGPLSCINISLPIPLIFNLNENYKSCCFLSSCLQSLNLNGSYYLMSCTKRSTVLFLRAQCIFHKALNNLFYHFSLGIGYTRDLFWV